MNWGERLARKFLLTVNLFWGIGVLLVLSCQVETEENNPKLIQYPVPFYQRNSECQKALYYGIQTVRFKLIKKPDGVCLLYDKLIDPLEVNNLAGLDEMIFIQLSLEKRLDESVEATKNQYISVQVVQKLIETTRY
jgi:hypothetical protein